MRILEGDGLKAAQAEFREHEMVEIWRGLGQGGILAAGEKIKAVEQADTGEMFLTMNMGGVRGEGDAQALGTGGVEEGGDAGQHGEREVATLVEFTALNFQGDPVGVAGKGVQRIEGVGAVADRAQEELAVKGHAVFAVHLGVSRDDGGLGVEDEAVEVEDEGLNHAGEGASALVPCKAWRVR